jgi:hypothetical protein
MQQAIIPNFTSSGIQDIWGVKYCILSRKKYASHWTNDSDETFFGVTKVRIISQSGRGARQYSKVCRNETDKYTYRYKKAKKQTEWQTNEYREIEKSDREERQRRETERWTDRETDRHRKTERQTNRQTERQRDREEWQRRVTEKRDRETDRHTYRQRDREKDEVNKRQAEEHTKYEFKQTVKIDRQTDRRI